MAPMQSISRLGGWEGYQLVSLEEVERDGQRWCVVWLAPIARGQRRCSGCGQPVRAVHDVMDRRVRDLPLFDARVELVVP